MGSRSEMRADHHDHRVHPAAPRRDTDPNIPQTLALMTAPSSAAAAMDMPRITLPVLEKYVDDDVGHVLRVRY